MYTSCFIKITCFILILDSFRILWDHLSSVVQAAVPASTHNRPLRPYAVDDPHCEMELNSELLNETPTRSIDLDSNEDMPS